MTTLRELHKKLKIKQTLDNYVRNTNKKYKYNFVPDEVLGEGMAKLIELNTQGKLGRHAQQIAYINHNLSLQRQKEQLEQANKRLAKRAEKAQELLDTELLKNSYIETLEMFSKFNSAKQYTMWDDLETPTKVIEFMEKNGVKQGKWLRPEGVEAGTLKLVGTNKDRIRREVEKLLNDEVEYKKMSDMANPYGDGNASKRIVDILLEKGDGIYE